MKKYCIIFLILLSALSNAQTSIYSYRYAVVPAKFEFLNEPDQYKLNTYTKMYMEKYGFEAFFNNAVPPQLANENCDKVYVELASESTMFATKIVVTVKDCRNNVLFRSSEGVSRDKEYKVSYTQALREAFKSFDALGPRPATVTFSDGQPKVTTGTNIKIVAKADPVSSTATKDVLFAQPVENGYQLVDTTPKVVLKSRSTSMPNVFIAERDNVTGVLFLQNGIWLFEFYLNGKLHSEALNIKF
ncbi:MAG TPA: hypothetical protein VF676_09575 [Flavobacterium sp.]|jgi:hypothetical protein